jgi:hypothetical protein
VFFAVQSSADCIICMCEFDFRQAQGIVHGGAPFGDFDLAPGPMRVEGDEEIDGAVAAVLVWSQSGRAKTRRRLATRTRPAGPTSTFERRCVAQPIPVKERSVRTNWQVTSAH